jgi:hypothetical protein
MGHVLVGVEGAGQPDSERFDFDRFFGQFVESSAVIPWCTVTLYMSSL